MKERVENRDKTENDCDASPESISIHLIFPEFGYDVSMTEELIIFVHILYGSSLSPLVNNPRVDHPALIFRLHKSRIRRTNYNNYKLKIFSMYSLFG